MAVYYVRKSGSNANDGLSPANAWLTIDHAANNVAAGDTVYIGAGIYRELVTLDTSGSSGSSIRWIGDVSGAQTGDPGFVMISAHDADDAGPVRAQCLAVGTATFNEFENIVFMGGSSGVVPNTTAHNWEGIVFDTCAFLSSEGSDLEAFVITYNDAAQPTGNGLRLRNSVVIGQIKFSVSSAGSSQDMDALLENLVVFGNPGSSEGAIDFSGGGSTAAGGVKIHNCLLACADIVINADVEMGGPATEVRNCLIIAAGSFYFIGDFTTNLVTSDNVLHSWGGTGGFDATETNNEESSQPLMIGAFVDHILRKNLGFSPYAPWEPISANGYTNPLIGRGNATYAPADDLYSNERPMGRNTDDAGPAEAVILPTRETTTVPSGEDDAAKFEGAGHIDSFHEVDGSAITVSVQARKDSNYTGSEPIVEVYDTDGTLFGSDALSVAADTWEGLSVAGTPAAAGVIRVRRRSRDTSATGICYFGEVSIS